MKRRTFLKASATSAAAIALNPVFPSIANDDNTVVANWGGDWNARTVRYIEAPLLETHGHHITHVLGGQPERQTMLLGQGRLPRGRIDVAHFDQTAAYILYANGVLENIDYSRIPNAAHLIDTLKTPYFMPWLFSGWEVLYNPDKVKDVPDSYTALANPNYSGRVGLMNEHFDTNMWVASLLASGGLTDFEGAKRQLLALKNAVHPRTYPTHQQLEAAFKSGQISIGTDFKSRGWQFHADGVNVIPAFPKEGPVLTIYGVCIPKNAPNKDAAYRYLNALLDSTALAKLCQANFYAPSSSAVVLPPDVQKKIGYTQDQIKLFHIPNEAYWLKNHQKWFAWWNSTFLG